MTKKIILLIVLILAAVFIFKITSKSNINVGEAVNIDPINHASMILNWDDKNIYTDPVDENKADIFAGKRAPDMILITDIHPDHLDVETLKKIATDKTIIITPMAVADMLPATIKGTLLVMKNGQKTDQLGFNVEAIPMYNLPGPSENYHTKGRGNGYVIEKPARSAGGSGERVYISGDTAGIPEMRNLQNIDMAFVAMNLPYTMGVPEAADAVLAFHPKKVYPYHYRTPEGFSDVAKFKEIVNSKDPNIEVVQLDWYQK